MTAQRFGSSAAGEYAALRSVRAASDAPAAAPLGRATAPRRRRTPSSWIPRIPPQHGAWAFLTVPVLVAFAITGAPPAGWLLLAAWLAAYPAGYYGGRALTARARRGSWTRVARREADRALPWSLMTAVLGLPLVLTRPWLLPCAVGLAALWALGLAVAARLGERSMANDLLLVAQAVAAVPLTVAVVAGPGALSGAGARDALTATALVAAYLAGSVLHVKSLIREADRPGFRLVSIGWHAAALLVAVLASPWWAIGFAPALARAALLRPGLRPASIGAVEVVVSVLVVVAAFAALPSG